MDDGYQGEHSSFTLPISDVLCVEWQRLMTQSGARSAQFEHQILITVEGYEILTKRSTEQIPSQ